jgi:hypothetical protein
VSRAYCAISDVRTLAGLEDTGDVLDATITAAIADASDSIERYCADYFSPVAGVTVRAELGGRGVAMLPLTVTDPATSVTNVVFEATSTSLASVSYRVHSSTMIGDYDGIQFAVAGWDDTINGAERENGGFATLFAPGRFLIVTLTAGKPTTPGRVVRQCALLAAGYINGTTDVEQAGIVLERGAGGRGGAQTGWQPGTTASRTTGDSRVDRALREFRRDAVAATGI